MLPDVVCILQPVLTRPDVHRRIFYNSSILGFVGVT